MAGKMCKEQRIHLRRYLIGSIVTNARKCGELVWRGDGLACPFGSHPTNRVVLTAPDEQGWVADQMETPVAMANGGYDIECVADQSVHMVTGVIGRIGSRTGGITLLVRRNGEIARLRCCMHLGIPEER
jgi:hypothetical protein